MPYLNQGEFYSEFGNFDVTITLPANYVVGASGVLQTESEKEFLDREGFSFLKDVKKVKGVTSDWDKKGRVKYDLDLETGKVSGKKNVLDAVSETPEQLRDLTKEMTERTRGKVEPFKFEEQKKVFAELREKTAKADARRAENPNLMDIGDIFDENRKLYEQAADVAVDSKTFVENLVDI